MFGRLLCQIFVLEGFEGVGYGGAVGEARAVGLPQVIVKRLRPHDLRDAEYFENAGVERVTAHSEVLAAMVAARPISGNIVEVDVVDLDMDDESNVRDVVDFVDC